MALNAAQKLGVSEDTLAKAMNMLAASRYDRIVLCRPVLVHEI